MLVRSGHAVHKGIEVSPTFTGLCPAILWPTGCSQLAQRDLQLPIQLGLLLPIQVILLQLPL